MSYELNARHYENVIKLPAAKRYEYFIKRAADWQEVWSLRSNEGFKLAIDNDGRESFPIWPHRIFAEMCADGGWADSTPARIGLSEWLEGWIPELTEDRRLVSVFPLPSNVGTVVEPSRIAQDLREELSRIE